MDYFLGSSFKESSPVFIDEFLCFLISEENPYALTYFLIIDSIEYHRIVKHEECFTSIY